MMKAYESAKIGENRGRPRLWLEGFKASLAGFLPGIRFSIRKDEKRTMLTLEQDVHGDRIVSRKLKGDKEVPVIDINSSEVLSIFEGYEAVRVIVQENRIRILPLAVEIAKRERLQRLKSKLANGEALSCGSVSHGGGVLDHALHKGLEEAGIKTQLAFANEIRPELLEHTRAQNDIWSADTVSLAAPLQELAFDDWAMSRLPKVEALFAGLPCSGASVAGRAKIGAGHAEAHPEVGHLVVAFLAVIAKVNPAIIVLEKPYASTGSMCILRNQLRDFGYAVHETVLQAQDWNALEHRERMCMVAVTHGMHFDFDSLVRPPKVERTVSEVLDDVPEDSDLWSPMQGLKDKEARDKAAGKNSKARSTDPKLQHPSNPDLLRHFTPAEHARLKQIPTTLIAGLGMTIAHELLGQSICYEPFRAVGRCIGKTLLNSPDGALLNCIAQAMESSREAAIESNNSMSLFG
jgi:DNA (cytosine-5)-methyltransferase 1